MQFKLTGRGVIESLDAIKRLGTLIDNKPMFKFDAKTRMFLAKCLRKVVDLNDLIASERERLMAEHHITQMVDDKTKEPVDKQEDIKRYNDAYAEVLKVSYEIDCGKLPISALDLELNVDIPFHVVTALDWMIDWAV